jgi:hypothetical protein
MKQERLKELEDMIKRTAKNLSKMKKEGKTHKNMSIDGVLSYCDIANELCKEVKRLKLLTQER